MNVDHKLYDKGKTVHVDAVIGEVKHNGRTYRVLDESVDAGPYRSIRLYNATGKFIKRLMIDPEAASEVGRLLQAGRP